VLSSWLRRIGMELNNETGALRCGACGGTQPVPRLSDGRLAIHGWRCVAGCVAQYDRALTALEQRPIRDPKLRERVSNYLEGKRVSLK